jgi:hypothetical protein
VILGGEEPLHKFVAKVAANGSYKAMIKYRLQDGLYVGLEGSVDCQGIEFKDKYVPAQACLFAEKSLFGNKVKAHARVGIAENINETGPTGSTSVIGSIGGVMGWW